MPQPVELRGRPASPGLAIGPIVQLSDDIGVAAGHGDCDAERQRLADAVDVSIQQIQALIDKSDEEASDILEFQIAMLADDELSAGAFDAIAQGRAGHLAWSDALDSQITEYAEAEDDYFRARAADLADIKDRVLRVLSGAATIQIGKGAILASDDITPTRFLETDWSEGGGLILSQGSPSSHVAMLARSRGVPMVTGLGFASLEDHRLAQVDGEAGLVTLSPGEEEATQFQLRSRDQQAKLGAIEAALGKPARTSDGTAVGVLVNIGEPSDTGAIDIATCDGVGLMRTEFLFKSGSDLLNEDMQFEAYRQVLAWAGDKPVTIRTMDAGGDKPIAGLTIEESNPFLGLRGIRLSLSRPDVFSVQLRALARAACHGNLKIMLPMVTVPEELDEASQLLDASVQELERAAIPCRRPELGIMVEVPAVAILPERFDRSDFFSIGSNDLAQYVTAASRDGTAVAALNDAGNPAVLRLINTVCRFGVKAGKPVSLCGDAGSDPRLIPDLIQNGVRTVSVAPALLGRTKVEIARVEAGANNG